MKVETEERRVFASRERSFAGPTKQDFVETLEQHAEWVHSHGEEGRQAELSRATLRGAYLSGVNLQGAFMHQANCVEVDLSLADLRGACLTQANLRGANLLGAKLREADLQGANLEGVNGLSVVQLAASNLRWAVLPDSISEFPDLRIVDGLYRKARWLLAVMLLASAAACAIVATTTDARLLNDSASIPLPGIGRALPLVGFYLIAPVLLLAFYIYSHLYLQRLWERLAELPAVFPDGRTLDKTGPWLLMGLMRNHFKWLRENRPALSSLETALQRLIAYWVVPATLLLFWVRYLTRQDLHSAMLHVVLIVSAIALATFLPGLVGRTLRAERQPSPNLKTVFRNWKIQSSAGAILGIGIILSLLSFGLILGVPHDTGRAPEFGATNIRRWAANVAWKIGYSPFADIAEASVSARPANWTGQDEALGSIAGAHLNRLSLRYAEGYRAFLVNAHLEESDLQNAFLPEADLRGANLHQANLESAALDRARFFRANLQGARLEKANLTQADLREADLSRALLADAVLVDAKLGGANLYAANLQNAQLLRANLEKADLRSGDLSNAKLAFADLRDAYLWPSTLRRAELHDAQLRNDILIEVNFEEADLSRADLEGTLLRGANLRGADLEGADLRGAVGLSAEQVCSAARRRDVKLDEELQHQVETQCGTVR
jgi:uncharacterized protein YjbI with pentapeptide repeats